MHPNTFNAFRISEEDGQFNGQITSLPIPELKDQMVLIRVLYSGINYKDLLSASGNKGITKRFPHTPGIDAAGIVESSAVPDFPPGMQVVVMGYDLGMNTDGGFGEYVQVPW